MIVTILAAVPSQDARAAETEPVLATIAPSALAKPTQGPLLEATSTGSRVEDVSQRTETTQVFANPDGTWTAETAAAPVRAKGDDGRWSSIDTNLEKVPGGYAPANVIGDVLLSEGGNRTFAQMTVKGRDLDWRWPTTLPVPEVEGDTATYPNVVEHGDLVIKATATGFQHNIVLREAPSGPVTYEIPIVTSGPSVDGDDDGSIVVETRTGDELVSASAPVMYDADQTAHGTPNSIVPVGGEVTPTANGGVLALTPDMEFLSDPATSYPVTIDPVVTQWTRQDTWVDSANPTASNVSSTELRAGTPDNGSHIFRSFMVFWNEAWHGKEINAATLKMANFATSSCATGEIRAYRVTEPWNSGIAWNSKPAATHANSAGYVGGKGGTGCAEGWLGWDVTNIVKGWSNGTFPNYGFRVGATTETGTNTYRRFWSIEHGTDAEPMLLVNYKDMAVENLTVSPCEIECDTWPVIDTATPTLSVSTTEPNGAAYNVSWNIIDTETGAAVASHTQSIAPVGAGQAVTSSWAVPEGVLSDDHLYGWSVTASNAVSARTARSEFELVMGRVDTGGETTDEESSGIFTEDTFDSDSNAPSNVDSLSSITALTDDTQRNARISSQSSLYDGDLRLNAVYDPEPPVGGKKIPRAGWSPCGFRDSRYKVAKDYYRKSYSSRTVSGYALLYCGRTDTIRYSDNTLKESKFGYRHILDKHLRDYEAVGWSMGRSWRDLAGWMIAWTLYDPDKVSQGAERFCYERKFVYLDAQGRKLFEGRNIVLLGRTGMRIMTSFPRYTGTYCGSGSNTGPLIHVE